MKRTTIFLMVFVLLSGTLAWFGCSKEEGSFERAGKQLDKAAGKAAEEVEKAKEEIKKEIP